ncbi:MAG: 50S ribosomal protein L28 [Candidatus Paceibacterota bacterium]
MRQCQICGKGSIMRNARKKLRGIYNPTGKKRKYPNLQKTRSPEGKRISACTTCIKKITRSK